MQTTRVLGSHYRVGELIGRGAMGEVYVVTDADTGDNLAAKILRAEHTDDDEVMARFLLERRVLRELQHPNIVRVRELVVDRDAVAIVMDLVDGTDLRQVLRSRGRLAPADAVRIAIDVLSALAFAHSMAPSVVHRDVKPDNVLIGRRDDHVYLTDFGVARLVEVGTSVRVTAGVGTADYMAPEMSSRVGGSAVDVYATGIMLFELLTGHTPFGTDNFQAVALRHLTCQPPPIDGLPSVLAEVLSSLLVKRPDSRPDAATAAARLRAVLPELVDVSAMRPTSAPTEWAQAGGAAVDPENSRATTRTRHELEPTDDARKATHLRSWDVAPPDLPVAPLAGVAVSRADALPSELLNSVTNLVDVDSRERERQAVAPTAAPTAGAARTKTRTLLFAGAAGIAALAIVVIIALVVGVGGDDSLGEPTRSSSLAPAQTIELTGGTKTYLAPLSVTRSAAFDASTGELTVSLAFSASANVTGPFLEIVPPRDGSDCPVATPGAGVSLTQYEANDEVNCAVQLTPPGGVIGARRPWSASYVIDFGKVQPDRARSAVASWLSAAASQLDEALAAFGRSSTDFAVQRYFGFVAEVAGSVTAGAPVPIVISPEWGDSGTDNNHPLFTSASGSAESLASKLGLDVRFEPGEGGCGVATISTRDAVPIVSSSTGNCSLDVTVSGQRQALAPFAVKAG